MSRGDVEIGRATDHVSYPSRFQAGDWLVRYENLDGTAFYFGPFDRCDFARAVRNNLIRWFQCERVFEDVLRVKRIAKGRGPGTSRARITLAQYERDAMGRGADAAAIRRALFLDEPER